MPKSAKQKKIVELVEPALDMNPQFLKALKILKEGKKNIFITGRAGTGKSTLLNFFCIQAKKEPVLLAPTGVAALNIKGQTIHSFFRFAIDVSVEKIKKQKRKPKNHEIYKNLKTLIIDEISMVRADTLDCIDIFLRKYGPNQALPFGGVQMIFVGDLYQMAPVVKTEEQTFFSYYYKTPFFFSAKVFEEDFKLEIIQLEKVYRQKDPHFINVLNRIRNNSIDQADIDWLNDRYLPDFSPKKEDFYITLTSRNKNADQINDQNLKNLEGEGYLSTASIDGSFGKEYFPTSSQLRFKEGAQIMLLNNDSNGRWVNGTVGRILSIDEEEETIEVMTYPAGEIVSIARYSWKIYKFSYSKTKKAIVSELAGSFSQYPFRLAWAVTIHKSQGKTFDRVIIDFQGGIFATGQAYVALSRCSSFEGMILKSQLKKYHIKTDYRIFSFLTKYQYQQSEKEMPLPLKLQKIRSAIKAKKQIEITYLKANDMRTERVIKPLFAGPHSYAGREYEGVTAFCLKVQEERVFRIDRILKLKIL